MTEIQRLIKRAKNRYTWDELAEVLTIRLGKKISRHSLRAWLRGSWKPSRYIDVEVKQSLIALTK